jgi:hypothetical protein
VTGPKYTERFAPVLAEERRRIEAQRAQRGVGAGPLVGLALSGGGIRSACFGLGVLQGLEEREAFRRIDYLSTVSGGGYIGAALTWFTRRGRGGFPFSASSFATPLDFIRRQASYLSPSPRLTLLSLAAVVLQEMVVSLFVYGSLLVGFFFVLRWADGLLRPVKAILGIYVEEPTLDLLMPATNLAALLAFVLLAVFVVSALWTTVASYAVGLWRGQLDAGRLNYPRRLRHQRHATRLLRWALGAAVIASVPIISLLMSQWIEQAWARGTIFGVVSTIAGVVGTIVLRRSDAAPARGTPSRLRAAFTYVLMVVLLLGVLLFCYTIALMIARGGAVWSIVLVAAGIAVGFMTNPNAHGCHRVYRDRLMEAFMPDASAVTAGAWQPAMEATAFPLSECSDESTAGPYPLLNASLTTVSSPNPRLRSRGADSFVLSPLYCGSAATGWRTTRSWQLGGLTLVAATAISAAAANPYAAVAGRGATRGPVASMLLALLNLRLGYVTRNPSPSVRRPWRNHRPNLILPGLANNLLGAGLAESRPYIQLADGGDFENLGLYELVRRRVDVIIAADGSQDAELGCGALGDAVERVRADFGVAIEFEDPDRDLTGLLSCANGFYASSRAYDHTRRPFGVARIVYPAQDGLAAKEGVLFYLKAVMFPGLPVDVLAYKAAHPAFPHESTFNQLFDEGKFEAYRGLGRAAALAMLSDDAALAALALTEPAAAPRPEPLRIVDPSLA